MQSDQVPIGRIGNQWSKIRPAPLPSNIGPTRAKINFYVTIQQLQFQPLSHLKGGVLCGKVRGANATRTAGTKTPKLWRADAKKTLKIVSRQGKKMRLIKDPIQGKRCLGQN